ncbi:MAG: hypothetical protein AAF481_08700 [Acidobacteriota bacterium]
MSLGLTRFVHYFGWLERLLPSPVTTWAVLLLAVGVPLIVRVFRRGGSSRGESR